VGKKPPNLTLVTGNKAKRTGPQPTRTLGLAGQTLFDRVMKEFQIEDIAGLEILTVACQCLDRAERLRLIIDRDGEMIKTHRGQLRAHPAMRDELANRAFLVRTLSKLGLDAEPLRPASGNPGYGGLGIGIGWEAEE
jgi:hypothetical protein